MTYELPLPYLLHRAARAELAAMLDYWRETHSVESRRRVRLAIRDVREARGRAWEHIREKSR